MMQEFVNQVKKAAKKATDEMHTAVPALSLIHISEPTRPY